MAYNPFNVFRRNQKAIFAVITVIIMFMFVLSSGMAGKADFFNWLPEWFGSKVKKGPSLCTIDGDKVYDSTLEPIRFKRVIANKYLMMAAQFAGQASEQRLVQLKTQASPALEQQLGQMSMEEQFGKLPPGTTARATQAMLDSKETKEADKQLLQMARVLGTFRQAMQGYAQFGTYLNRVPNRGSRDRDVIEFMLWDKKAKQLGIDYSAEDVKNTLLPKEFLGMFSEDHKVRQALVSEYRERYTDEICFQALAAEFRVRAAQMVLLGASDRSDRTLTAPPIFTAPYELFEFYRDKTSTTQYDVLRIPVEVFIPQVKETPSEADLDRLFKERKDYEPDPSREEPGFREPRRIKVEWISVNGEEAYYKTKAEEWVKRTEQFAKSEVRALIAPMPGLTPAAWASAISAPAAIKEPLVEERYKREVIGQFESRIRLGWTGLSTFVMPWDILETNVVKPQNLVAAAGGAAGAAGIGNPFLVPADLLYSATVAAEQKARIKACMPLFGGAIPGPSLLPTLVVGEAAFRKSIPEPLPLEAYKPELLKEIKDGKARELAVNDVKNLKKQIDELKETGKARENAAKDLIADFIKTRGVKTGSSADLVSEFTIADDPGLAPLKTVFEKDKNPHAALMGMGPVQFGSRFFWKTEGFGRAKEQDVGDFKPEFYPERAADMALGPFAKTDPVFLAWRTSDQKAHTFQRKTLKRI